MDSISMEDIRNDLAIKFKGVYDYALEAINNHLKYKKLIKPLVIVDPTAPDDNEGDDNESQQNIIKEVNICGYNQITDPFTLQVFKIECSKIYASNIVTTLEKLYRDILTSMSNALVRYTSLYRDYLNSLNTLCPSGKTIIAYRLSKYTLKTLGNKTAKDIISSDYLANRLKHYEKKFSKLIDKTIHFYNSKLQASFERKYETLKNSASNINSIFLRELTLENSKKFLEAIFEYLYIDDNAFNERYSSITLYNTPNYNKSEDLKTFVVLNMHFNFYTHEVNNVELAYLGILNYKNITRLFAYGGHTCIETIGLYCFIFCHLNNEGYVPDKSVQNFRDDALYDLKRYFGSKNSNLSYTITGISDARHNFRITYGKIKEKHKHKSQLLYGTTINEDYHEGDHKYLLYCDPISKGIYYDFQIWKDVTYGVNNSLDTLSANYKILARHLINEHNYNVITKMKNQDCFLLDNLLFSSLVAVDSHVANEENVKYDHVFCGRLNFDVMKIAINPSMIFYDIDGEVLGEYVYGKNYSGDLKTIIVPTYHIVQKKRFSYIVKNDHTFDREKIYYLNDSGYLKWPGRPCVRYTHKGNRNKISYSYSWKQRMKSNLYSVNILLKIQVRIPQRFEKDDDGFVLVTNDKEKTFTISGTDKSTTNLDDNLDSIIKLAVNSYYKKFVSGCSTVLNSIAIEPNEADKGRVSYQDLDTATSYGDVNIVDYLVLIADEVPNKNYFKDRGGRYGMIVAVADSINYMSTFSDNFIDVDAYANGTYEDAPDYRTEITISISAPYRHKSFNTGGNSGGGSSDPSNNNDDDETNNTFLNSVANNYQTWVANYSAN